MAGRAKRKIGWSSNAKLLIVGNVWIWEIKINGCEEWSLV